MKFIAGNRLRAPITAIRTPATRNHVDREIPVCVFPRPPVHCEVSQVFWWLGKRRPIRIRRKLSTVVLGLSSAVHAYEPSDITRLRALNQRRAELHQCLLRFSPKDIVDA